MLRKLMSLLVGLLVVGTAVTLPALPSQAAAPASGPLTCSASSTYYNYALSGTMTMPNAPSGITVVTTHHTTVPRYSTAYTAISNVTPTLDNSYAGGNYLRAGYNAWNLGVGAQDGAAYWLLLPNTTLGVISKGQIVANTGAPLPLGCQAPAATGNTGAFQCSAQLRVGVTYTVTGTAVPPQNPTDASVTRSGIIQGSHLIPLLDNTFGGGYWLTHYAWNSWAVQTDASGNGVWLMLPNTPLSRSFDAMILIQYANAGNNQLRTTCTIP